MSPLRFIGRVLTGRFTADDVATTERAHLLVGLLFAWLAGIGRYWDSRRANGDHPFTTTFTSFPGT